MLDDISTGELYEKAQKAIDNHNFAEAEMWERQLFALAAGGSKAHAKALLCRGRRLYMQRTNGEALQALLEAKSILEKLGIFDLQTHLVYLNIGYVLTQMGKYDEACRAFDLAAQLLDVPGMEEYDKMWVYRGRAIALMWAKRHTEAEEDALRAIQICELTAGEYSQDMESLQRFLASLYHQTGKEALAGACEAKAQYIRENPTMAVPKAIGDKQAAPAAPARPASAAGPKPQVQANPAELELVLEELDSLIGLQEVKDKVRGFTNFLRIQQLRKSHGKPSVNISHHLVFTGSPGTGKTSVARLFGRIFNSLGILATPKLVEADQNDLIAGYLGQTAEKVNQIIDSALDGVLFIDEAYSLTQSKEYGDEAISTLLKRMEDDRDRLVIIVAGYPDKMRNFIDANPGLESRFPTTLNFPDYSASELEEIFHKMAGEVQYELSPSALEKLRLVLNQLVTSKDESFGNARTVRNLFEASLTRQANRLVSSQVTDPNLMSVLEASDIELPES